jgi:hypothetical protein
MAEFLQSIQRALYQAESVLNKGKAFWKTKQQLKRAFGLTFSFSFRCFCQVYHWKK